MNLKTKFFLFVMILFTLLPSLADELKSQSPTEGNLWPQVNQTELLSPILLNMLEIGSRK